MFNEFMSFLRNDSADSPHLNPPPSARGEGWEGGLKNLSMSDMERTFARLFSSDDGKRVLGYLQAVTFQRALGPASSDEQLRYIEGQRAMVATILRLIDRGRSQ